MSMRCTSTKALQHKLHVLQQSLGDVINCGQLTVHLQKKKKRFYFFFIISCILGYQSKITFCYTRQHCRIYSLAIKSLRGVLKCISKGVK